MEKPPPINSQSAALTALLGVVTVLVAELARQKLIDTQAFDVALDDLMSRAPEHSEAATEMRDAILTLIKGVARGNKP